MEGGAVVALVSPEQNYECFQMLEARSHCIKWYMQRALSTIVIQEHNQTTRAMADYLYPATRTQSLSYISNQIQQVRLRILTKRKS